MDTKLEYEHPDYQANKYRWEFFLRSYMGGEDYQDGSYLTAYTNEHKDDYTRRIKLTPLDNHCKNIIHIYSSFLWRVAPIRNFNSLAGSPALESFIEDADLDGQSFNSFMREAQIWSSVYGHVWLMMDKPKSTAGTRAEELEQEIRPYITLFTPENVFDWKWQRHESGRFRLSYLKVRESVERIDDTTTVEYFRIWTKDLIEYYRYDGDTAEKLDEAENPLGLIPATYLPAARSVVRGIGLSDLSDIAYMQKAIYSELSEIEQLIRISNHPTLVKTFDTDATAGAGSIINMPEDIEPSLRPYQMQPSGQNLDAIRNSITDKVNAINRMAHMGAVRGAKEVTMSGVAMQTEFQLLNAKLSEKADILELVEEQLWSIFAAWQDTTSDVEVFYPDSFDLRDYPQELQFLQQVKASGVKSATLQKAVDGKIADLVLDDEELQKAHDEIDAQTTVLGQFSPTEEVEAPTDGTV